MDLSCESTSAITNDVLVNGQVPCVIRYDRRTLSEEDITKAKRWTDRQTNTEKHTEKKMDGQTDERTGIEGPLSFAKTSSA